MTGTSTTQSGVHDIARSLLESGGRQIQTAPSPSSDGSPWTARAPALTRRPERAREHLPRHYARCVLTPIHRALGLPAGEVDFELVQQAVAHRVAETNDLDWKAGWWPTQKPDWRDEVAKDLAAMANSGGGWLVVGIKEEPPRAEAVEVTPVEWSEDRQRRVRSVAYSHCGPPLTGLEFHPVPVPESDGYVVLIRVPDSPDAPHLSRKGDDAYRAPVRNGADTEKLDPRALEMAFKRRFQSSSDRAKQLTDLYEDATLLLDTKLGATLVAVADPAEPRQGAAVDRRWATMVLENPDFSGLFQRRLSNERVPAWAWAGAKVRRGPRRWVASREARPQGYAKALHDNGAVQVAYQIGTWDFNPDLVVESQLDRNVCRGRDVEEAVGDFVASLRTASGELQMTGVYHVRIGMEWMDPMMSESLKILDEDRVTGAPLPPGGGPSTPPAATIRRFSPVVVELDALSEIEGLVDQTSSMALDLVAHGGIENLRRLEFPDPFGRPKYQLAQRS